MKEDKKEEPVIAEEPEEPEKPLDLNDADEIYPSDLDMLSD